MHVNVAGVESSKGHKRLTVAFHGRKLEKLADVGQVALICHFANVL